MQAVFNRRYCDADMASIRRPTFVLKTNRLRFTQYHLRRISRNYPLMRCSVSILEFVQGTIVTDARAVGIAIAELKSRAKSSEAGFVFGTM